MLHLAGTAVTLLSDHVLGWGAIVVGILNLIRGGIHLSRGD
jgi:hypothetical protein